MSRESRGAGVAFVSLVALLSLIGLVGLEGQEPSPTDAPAGSPEGRSVEDGVFTGRQARRGEKRFLQFCEQCHRTRDFRTTQFAEKWAGQSVGVLLELIKDTMPEDNPGGLPAAHYADVLAYILQVNGYPDGQEELPVDPLSTMDVRMEPAEASPRADSATPP